MREFILTTISLLILTGSVAFSQADEEIDLEDFDEDLMEELIFDKINEYRLTNGMDQVIRHEVLDGAAQDQAEHNYGLGRIDSKDDIGKRVKGNGGTEKATALAYNPKTGKSKETYTYQKIANDCFEKWKKGRSNQKILETIDFFYGGVGATIDAEKSKVYITVVLGRVDALNMGADKKVRKSLSVPYGKKKYGLTAGDDRTCKNCLKFTNYQKLYDGISLVGNKVYLEYDNLKELKKLVRTDEDAIAIDFIIPEQYPCDGPNIYNSELPSKGNMTKPFYSKKIDKKNEVDEPRPKSFKGPIGKIKKKVLKGLPDNYEYNLVVIQRKTFCKTVTRGYLEDGGIESLTLLSVYPDTTNMSGDGAWVPEAVNQTITFKVPFEQSKYNYKQSDIEPIMEALDEPKYMLDDIFISAHSSLEGDSAINKKLQQKRAESIIEVIGEMKGVELEFREENVQYSYGYEIFQEQIKGDKEFEYFKGKTYEEMQTLLGEREVREKLEPLLKEQRYAEVSMQVTYDISGDNEEPFVLSQLKKAIDAKDGALALAIQKYAMKKVMAGEFKASNFVDVVVPLEAPFASVIVNQIFLDNTFNGGGVLDETLEVRFDELHSEAAENDFVAFNKYMLDVKYNSVADETEIKETQNSINTLYNGKISQQFVDALNLEFQFRIIEYFDSTGVENDMVENSLERIKKIYNIEGSSWQNALKLGYIFISYNDLDFATEIMAPFVVEEDADEELLFTYISAAANLPEKIFTKDFRVAMTNAEKVNNDRYCKLFGEPYSTFQLRDHPIIKEEYCSSCN